MDEAAAEKIHARIKELLHWVEYFNTQAGSSYAQRHDIAADVYRTVADTLRGAAASYERGAERLRMEPKVDEESPCT